MPALSAASPSVPLKPISTSAENPSEHEPTEIGENDSVSVSLNESRFATPTTKILASSEDIIEQLITLLAPHENTSSTKDPETIAYLDSCKSYGTIPSSYLTTHLNLSHVSLTSYGLGSKGATALAHVLESNRSILSLDLSGNGIEAEGGIAFGEMLKSNICLKELILNNNQLGGVGGQAIADGVTDNVTLHILSLKGNLLGDEEAIRFGTALRTNRTLSSLDLGHNIIGDIGASELGAGLDVNDALKAINLEWNHIRIKGISLFLNAVKDSSSLNKIVLSSNGFGETGGVPLAVYLARNNTLATLSIAHCRLTDASVPTLCKAIDSTYTLRELDLSFNLFSDTGLAQLLKAVVSNNSLKLLNISGMKMTLMTRAVLKDVREEKVGMNIIE